MPFLSPNACPCERHEMEHDEIILDSTAKSTHFQTSQRRVLHTADSTSRLLSPLCFSKICRLAGNKQTNDETEESEHGAEDFDDQDLDEPVERDRSVGIPRGGGGA